MPSPTLQPTSKWWAFLLIFTLFIAAENPRAGPANVLDIPDAVFCHYDKCAHFAVYGLVAIALYRVRELSSRGWRGRVLALLLTMLLGLGDEVHQHLFQVRYFEWADVAADWTGAFIALQLIKVHRIEKFLCSPIRLWPWSKSKPVEYAIELGHTCTSASKTWVL